VRNLLQYTPHPPACRPASLFVEGGVLFDIEFFSLILSSEQDPTSRDMAPFFLPPRRESFLFPHDRRQAPQEEKRHSVLKRKPFPFSGFSRNIRLYLGTAFLEWLFHAGEENPFLRIRGVFFMQEGFFLPKGDVLFPSVTGLPLFGLCFSSHLPKQRI